MKQIVYIFLLVLFSCNSEQKNATEKGDELDSTKIDSTNIRASNNLNIDSLSTKIQLLEKKFNFVEADFKGRSYYHKVWLNNKYVSQQDMLIAGVDSTGHFFLISTIRGGYPIEQEEHDAVEINIDSTAIMIASDTTMGKYKTQNMLICACRWEIQSYGGPEAFLVGEMIANSFNKEIRLTYFSNSKKLFRMKLSGKEKENIKDAYNLSKLITDRDRLRQYFK